MAQRPEWESVVTELVATRGDALQRYAMLLCGARNRPPTSCRTRWCKTFGRLRNGFSVESAEAYVRRAILNGSSTAAAGSRAGAASPRSSTCPTSSLPRRGFAAAPRPAPGTAQARPARTRLPGAALLRRPQGRRHRRDPRHQLRRGQALPERRTRQDGDRARRRRHRRGPARSRGALPAPATEPAPEDRRAQWPANLSCATDSTTARCPSGQIDVDAVLRRARPGAVRASARRRRIGAGDRRDRGAGDDRQLRASATDSALIAATAPSTRSPRRRRRGCGRRQRTGRCRRRHRPGAGREAEPVLRARGRGRPRRERPGARPWNR